jgi:hypothetical protein
VASEFSLGSLSAVAISGLGMHTFEASVVAFGELHFSFSVMCTLQFRMFICVCLQFDSDKIIPYLEDKYPEPALGKPEDLPKV